MSTDTHRYNDIIHLPHHVSKKHPQMSLLDRAAQFSPFAALTGYDAAIQETGRLTDTFVELEEYEKALLDEKIQILKAHLPERPTVTVTYFQPDAKKEGGAYVEYTGAVRRIDEHRRVLVMMDGIEVEMDVICGMEWDEYLTWK